jgi:non-canonical (house-cleaning) NTP pyrophosphatase
MNITLGSSSPLKLEAVAAACKVTGITAAINGIATDSGQNAQPIGFIETINGAQTRAEQALKLYPTHTVIGIENGILVGPDTLLDIAVVVILTPDDQQFVAVSRSVHFPFKYLALAKQKGLATTTIGQLIAEELGGEANDPHATLTNGKVTRVQLLTEAVAKALKKLQH